MSSKSKNPQPVKVSAKELDKLKKLSVEDPGLVKFASSIGSGVVAPLEESAIRKHSHRAMSEQLDVQMAQIVDQIKLLAKQVEDLQTRKRISEEIYLSKITFEPVIGNTYYLYFSEKENRKVLSMVSPDQWGKSGDHLRFLAEVVLHGDRTWKVIKSGEEEESKEDLDN